MKNLYRNKQLIVRLTHEEKQIFENKLAMSNLKSMSHFIRKCVLEKEIFVVDMTPIMKIQQLLSNQANNINQIAKKINTNGIIYRKDIDYIKQLNKNLSEEISKIQSLIVKKVYK